MHCGKSESITIENKSKNGMWRDILGWHVYVHNPRKKDIKICNNTSFLCYVSLHIRDGNEKPGENNFVYIFRNKPTYFANLVTHWSSVRFQGCHRKVNPKSCSDTKVSADIIMMLL